MTSHMEVPLLVSVGNPLDDPIWRAWIEKGRLRDRRATRRCKEMAGVALILIALAAAYYLGASA